VHIRRYLVVALLAGAAFQAGSALGAHNRQTPAGYSLAVQEICSGALLFDGSHQIGTRAGAIDVANDIRATGGHRLDLVDAVPKPAATTRVATRWIAVERRLVALYATNYLLIWDAIESANSPQELAGLPALVRPLLYGPDKLQGLAGRLEQSLDVPDCTGGAGPSSSEPIAQEQGQ
jgi:hypothetical protein